MSDKEYVAEIGAQEPDAKADEYPMCHYCESAPIAHLYHSGGLMAMEVCTNPDCEHSLERVCEKQISGSMIGKCIEHTGIDTLRAQIPEVFDMVNDYRAENDLPLVELPSAATA